LLLLLILAFACAVGDPSELTEAQKRERIDTLYEGYRVDFPTVPEITVDDLQGRLSGSDVPILIDVRAEEEQRVSILPGAISREEFEARREELSGRDVVTYCTIGYRSGLYARDLASQGLDVHNLRGSILAWTHGEGELLHEGRPTRRVHVYGKKWNLAAEGYEPVW
jgi:sodium/bile acid cotransporter 7